MNDIISTFNNDWREIEFYKTLIDETISYGIVQPGPHVEVDSIPMIRVQNIRNGRIDKSDVKKVSKSIAANYKRTTLKGGELLITVVGIIGECAIVPSEFRGWNVARAISVARIKDDYDINFIRYALGTAESKFQMYGNTNDTVQPTLNLKELKNIKLLIPPLPKQKAIASVLSSLDDKIDLLHRQNKTLEAMAETLFRQWFVEEAKEDWGEQSLDDVADYLNGIACQKYPPENEIEKLPVLKIKELRNGISENSDWATNKVSDEYIVKNGDVIFSWSGSLMVRIWDGERCILNQHLFKVTSNDYPKWFYYYWTKLHLEKFISIAESKSTTMGHIKREDLSSSMVLVPGKDELSTMDSVMAPLLNKYITNNIEIHTLEKLRDTLLPKLMSGEVRCTKPAEVRIKI